MRDYLFRGKPKYETHYYFFEKVHKENCIDGFVCGSLVVDGDRYFIAVSSLCSINSVINNGIISMIEVIPETVGQYTGLTDKNGKKIFEHDIVDVAYDINYVGVAAERIGMFKVVFHKGCFMKEGIQGKIGLFHFIDSDVCKIVGNIHDNPELLKGGEKR
ncbi:MAG: YopX family protein [Clostridiaceae bacterium]|nr:YopX family protein [Clostridiaceae bacterium]